MKTKALVLTFAVCAFGTGRLAAQQTPREELAPIVAVEEQERDLAKAERLYKEALAGSSLSTAAKELGTRRLSELLQKLGKHDEAKQWLAKLPAGEKGTVVSFDDVTEQQAQDRERQEALRGKARELVQKVLDQGSFPYPAAGGIFDDELRRQIEWLGEAAVPEIGAVLAAAKPTFAGKAASELAPSTKRIEALRGLAGILWRMGSPAARAQLEDLHRDGSEAFRALLVTQSARHAPALRELVVTWMHEEPSDEVCWQLARSGDETAGVGLNGQQGWIEGRSNWTELPTEVLLRIFESRSPAMRARALRSLPWGNTQAVVPFAAEAASRACAMIRVLANDTDPEAARNALAALANPRLQLTTEGFECVVEHLGRLGDELQLPWYGGPREWMHPNNGNAFSTSPAARIWPALAHAAMRGVSRGSREWVRIALNFCTASLDGSIVDEVIALHARGFTQPMRYMSGSLDQAQAMRLVHAFAEMGEGTFQDGIAGLSENDLPPEALPVLVGKTELAVRLKLVRYLASLVARTGNPAAVAWLLEQAKADEHVRGSLDSHLLQLGRRTSAGPVRAAMRERIDPRSSQKAGLLMALLSMHDVPSLAILAAFSAQHLDVRHPFAKAEDSPGLSPLLYLLMEQPDPPHGFTQTEIVDFVRGLLANDGADIWGSPAHIRRIPDHLVMELAAKATGHLVVQQGATTSTSSWQEIAAQRIGWEEDLQGPWHRWLLGIVGTDARWPAVMDHLRDRDRAALRPLIEPMLTGDNAEWAEYAFRFLARQEVELDYEALTFSKHPRIVEMAAVTLIDRHSLSLATALRLMPTSLDPYHFARYCGENAMVDAVPTLLHMVQQPDTRRVATEALTKIRFVHEQRSYWDRITKGLDASPTSAVEKLLLQGKPGAPTEQRLLAITSLGALGVPEALPFLIEWTQDPDANVAKAAKDAITQIHLNPRR